MKLYWKIYLFLAATTLVTLVISIWLSFSVLPDRFNRQSMETLDRFEERVMDDSLPTIQRVQALADSMGVLVRFVRNDHQPQPFPGQSPPPQGLPAPIEREWRGVRLISPPGAQYAMLASISVDPPRFFILVLLAMGLFLSQAAALALGLRPVFKRTSLLTRITGEFGKGQLSARYPDHGGGDEIDALGNAFNTMADRILSLLGSHKELLNSVAHELRTPMARLSFALELARNDPATVVEKLGLMEKDIFELDRLVTELLEFNRIGSFEPSIEKVSLADICHEAADAERSQSASVDISVVTDGSETVVAGDGRLLLRAVSNLVRNSVHYAETSVTVTVRSTNSGITVSVTDDGPGFPAGFAERAVNPFVKGEGSRGVGLGLSIVKRIAEKHRGSLSLKNSPGGGARADLTIPT